MGLMRGVLKFAALGKADLSGANLSRANLEFAKLQNANLANCNLNHVDLAGADLSNANLPASLARPPRLPPLSRISLQSRGLDARDRADLVIV
jgi:uncharacterized protein YjbI with pentapeptide repeats